MIPLHEGHTLVKFTERKSNVWLPEAGGGEGMLPCLRGRVLIGNDNTWRQMMVVQSNVICLLWV